MKRQSIGSCRKSFSRFRMVIAGLACLAGVLSVGAEQVSSGLATRAVNTLIALSGQMDTPIKGTVASMRLCTATNGAAFYVAKLAGGGFVVTSTDTEIDPIIAISSESDLVEDPRNPLWSLLVSDMAARREAVASKGKPRASSTSATSAGKAVTSTAAARWARLTSRDTGAAGASKGKSTISDVRVAPLLKTKWGQSYVGGEPCFNYYTPWGFYTSYGYVCGCGATAVAQLLRYHKFPTEYVEPEEYPCKIDGWDQMLWQIGGWYDWDNMPEVPGRGTTDEQREAIGRLTYDVGVAIHSEYTQNITMGYEDYVVDLLKKWDYAHATEYWFRSFHPFDYDGGPYEGFTEDEMKSVMIPNLDARLPMCVRIYKKVPGDMDDYAHFVVADGYGYLNGQWSVHLNFGWDGNSDAWYVLPECSAGGYLYTAINRIVANIYPEGPSSAGIVSGRVVSSTTSKPAAGIVVAARNGYGEVEYSTTDANGIYSFILPGLEGMVWNEDKWPGYDYDLDDDDYLNDDRYGNPDQDAGEPWEIYIENVNVSSYSRNIRDGENHYGLDFAISIHTVKLDANGGKVTPATIDVVEDGTYGELPMPNRKGHVFAGWWTAKDGGEHMTSGKNFDLADFAGQKTLTLYAHWLKMQKLTLKDDSAYASWELDEEDFDPEIYEEMMESIYMADPDFEGSGYLNGKGVMEVLPGARVSVSVAESSSDKNGKKLGFQKWTVSPSGANLGADFDVTKNEAQFTMPAADVTLQATYIDPDTCGYLSVSVYGSDICLYPFGQYDDTVEHEYINVPFDAFEWSPDGGKTWYKAMSDGAEEDSPAMLKAGKYTITWRSNDPSWEAPSKKTVTVDAGESQYLWGNFSYIPQVVVDVMTYENGECTLSSAGGSVTMNPKDGFVPCEKTIAFTAKAAKGYAFQGYALDRRWDYEGESDVLTPWQYGDAFSETASTWKFMNEDEDDSYYLNEYIDCDDRKVHVVAVFKALSAYSADDIAFSGFTFGRGGSYAVDGDVVNVRAVAGCAVNDSLCSAPAASPLSYKLVGKLPDGLKFDAKTGVLSGVPKKAGKATVTITASDPAKNSKDLTVAISVAELPPWLEGVYRGIMSERQQNGLLELSVKSDGKVSAKVLTRYGSRSASGTLEWRDPEASYVDTDDDEEADGEDELAEFRFWHTDAKDDSCCHVNFYEDGTICGYVDSFDKKEDDWAGGDMTGLRQDKELLPDSEFLDKYYTFAFSAVATSVDPWEDDETTKQSGYGYLTLKTDKAGGVKVAGQLPDGEKVSMSALVMPCLIDSESEPTTDNIAARLYLFASPSSYKKLGWFAMQLMLIPDGLVVTEEGAAWNTSSGGGGCGKMCSPGYGGNSQVSVSGEGALYSAAATLENYYWNVRCAWSEDVLQQYSYKYLEENEDNPSKPYSWTEYGEEYAKSFDGYFFNVAVKGDSKGAISLVEKSPAPWEESKKEDGVTSKEWNYTTDKKGNPITDASQLSISFTKATGIFTGKATVYFDYDLPSCKQNSQTKQIEWTSAEKHATATLPYAGVMIATENEGEKDYRGFGSAVYTYKYSYTDENNKAKTETEKISLPVSLESAQADDEEP